MKILQIITLADCGGAQIHLLELIKGLQNKLDFEVIVGEKGFLTDRLDELKIKYYIVNSLQRELSLKQDYLAFQEIKNLIKTLKPDLIHCHSSKAGIIGRCVAFICKIPAVFTAHGWAFHPKVNLKSRLIALLAECLAGLISQKIICVSDFDYELALKTKLFPKTKLTTIHNGLAELDLNSYKNYEFSFSEPENNKSVKILMAARFAEPKRQDLLILAFSELIKKTNQNIILLLAGEGSQKSACKELAKSLNLSSHIHFLGEIYPIEPLIEKADIFCLISEREGLPISLLEAARQSKPLIASAVGGIPEIIENQINGFLINNNSLSELQNALLNSLNNNLLIKMGHESRKIFDHKFTLKIMLKAVSQVYEQLIPRTN